MDVLSRCCVLLALGLYLISISGLIESATINARQSQNSDTRDYPSWLKVAKSSSSISDDTADYAGDDYAASDDYDYDDDCPECEIRRIQLEKTLSEKEIRNMRIELIKKQILRKLRLPHRPNITRTQSLPAPVLEAEYTADSDYQSTSPADKNVEDFYGQTTQAIIFADEVDTSCYSRINKPSGCFHFKLADDVRGKDIISAELWALKTPDSGDNRNNQTLLVSELQPRRRGPHKPKYPLDIVTTTEKTQWAKFDVSKVVNKWIHGSNRQKSFQITCKTCRDSPSTVPVSTNSKNRPFIVIEFDKAEKRRAKRSQNCNGDCCMERMYVSFSEIGWNDWVLKPDGYFANYCIGSCHGPSNRIKVSRMHAGVMQDVANIQQDPIKKAAIMPCCTPTRMSSLSMLYKSASENSILTTTIPNMIAESCGCS